jgi:2-polyprenyl-6-methoxyphenol hydroxylase-like FAD-dependent oxidoreductase
MSAVVVAGAGVGGLSAALKLARAGHRVTVVERDDTPMPDSPDAAFAWDRRGAPQVRHSHAFLARLVLALRTNEPDVYDALVEAGATPMPFGADLPPTITDFSPQPGDADLTMLACRRTTFEWVLRRTALAEGGVRFVTGVAVDGLVVDRPGAAGATALPRVRGVRLSDGSMLAADLVVAANGRRGNVADWYTAVGATPPAEEVEDTGIVYTSRFYRLRDGEAYPPRSGLIGGDLGYLKYGVFVGDNRTFSITLATPSDDTDLRRTLTDPVSFEATARLLPVAQPFVDGRAEPITAEVHLMAGLLNRWRDYRPGGRASLVGVVPVGDALVCTNPLYGRGCTTAYWSADLLASAMAAHPDDVEAMAVAYDDSVREQILPWYRAGVAQDADARRVARALLAGEDPDGDTSDPRTFMRAVFRDGLLPALRSDVVVLRAFVRNLNLLTPPDTLATDPEIGARVLAVWQDRDNRPPEPDLGPKRRDDLLAALAA